MLKITAGFPKLFISRGRSASPRLTAVILFFACTLSLQALDVDGLVSLGTLSEGGLAELKLAAGEGSGPFFDHLLDNQDHYDDFLLASAFQLLNDQSFEDLVPRILLGFGDRDRSVKVLLYTIRMYLLRNQASEALRLAESLNALVSDEDVMLELAQIRLLTGDLAGARSTLSRFLQVFPETAVDQYDRSLLLLSALLVQEGNPEAARQLLAGRLTEENAARNLYRFQASHILETLAGEAGQSGKDAPFRQDPGLSAFPDMRLLPGPGGQLENIAILQEPELSSEPVSIIQTAPDTGEDAAGENAAVSGIIQLGVFSNRENAERYRTDLLDAGFPGFIFNEGEGFRVLLDSRDPHFMNSENYNNPRRLLLVLKEEGIEGFLVSDPRY